MSILIIDTLTLLWSDQLTMSLKFYPVMMLEVCMNIKKPPFWRVEV